MTKLFGTDGIRGKAGNFPIDNNSMEILGFTLAEIAIKQFKQQPVVFIGYDTRESAENIFNSIAKGFCSLGGTVYDLGIVPTPLISFIALIQKQFSISITASHNPYDDNGIKIIGPDGFKVSEMIESIIENAILNQNQLPYKNKNPQLSIINFRKKAISIYKELLISKHFSNLDLSNMSIAVDVANGAGYEIIPNVLKDLGASVIVYNNEPNGKNINYNCGALHPEFLRDAIKGTTIQIGAAYDGDADRAIFCDSYGNIYDGDIILAIFAEYLKNEGKLNNQSIVCTIMSNIGLELFLEKKNIKLVRVPVGDKYVIEKMLELNYNLGGEQSGHIVLSDIIATGDGLITTLKLLSILKNYKTSIKNLCSGFKKYPQTIINIKVKSKIPLEEVPELYNEYLEIKQSLNNRGRIILRYSGTEPVLRIMVEAPSHEELKYYSEKISSIAKTTLS